MSRGSYLNFCRGDISVLAEYMIVNIDTRVCKDDFEWH